MSILPPITNIKITKISPEQGGGPYNECERYPCWTFMIKWNRGEKEYGTIMYATDDLPDKSIEEAALLRFLK